MASSPCRLDTSTCDGFAVHATSAVENMMLAFHINVLLSNGKLVKHVKHPYPLKYEYRTSCVISTFHSSLKAAELELSP